MCALSPAPAAPLDSELLSCVTYLSPNEHGATLLSGHCVRADESGVDAADLTAVTNILLDAGAQKLLVTLGANGSVLCSTDKQVRTQCVRMPQVVNSTAAGDSFVAAFCTGISAGLSEQHALEFASHMAAITVSAMGDMPSLPHLAAVQTLMREHGCTGFELSFAGCRKEGWKPLKQNSIQAIDSFIASAKEELSAFADTLSHKTYTRAVELIQQSQRNGGRLHITGIGKPAHVAAYAASLLSSTGNPCYFLHGTEAVHGSCGQLVAGDVVVAISNSGNTAELKSTVLAVQNNGCKVIGVTGNPNSWLAKQAEAVLLAGVANEGGPLNRAPRNSVLAELLTLQALSVALQAEKDWNAEQYVRCHPGGTLGQLREDEKRGGSIC